MTGLVMVVLPVFLVIGFGYVAAWRDLFAEAYVDGLMKFTQNFAIPCLLFNAIASIDLRAGFDITMLISYFAIATVTFYAGMFGARLVFKRAWADSVAIGFLCLFANAVLLGLPVTERAYGTAALENNFAIIAFHAPFCYGLGIVTMEIVRAEGQSAVGIAKAVVNAVFHNALILGIALGFAVNLLQIPIPEPVQSAVDLMVRAALPAALFGLGGVLYRYRPEGDMMTIIFVITIVLIIRPALNYGAGISLSIDTPELRAMVLTGAMAPGVNGYMFANMYGVAKRVAASTVLVGTAISVLTLPVWLYLLP
jgi:malonate transporter